MSIEELINTFNEKFPVGAEVRWRSIGLSSVPFRTYTVKTAAYNHHGMAVCFLNEHRGMVSIDPKFVDYK